MSDSVNSFEFILKKQSYKKTKSLYNNNKQQNKPTFTPQDVISNVSSQLRAMKAADSYQVSKTIAKDLNKYKSSTYLSVNKLPMYEEPPKQSAKFDTQCVTDTQLINIIEDAETIERYQGMTDAFETPFSQINTEKQTHIDDVLGHSGRNYKNSCDLEDLGKGTNENKQNHDVSVEHVDKFDESRAKLDVKDSNLRQSDIEIVSDDLYIQNNNTGDKTIYGNEDMVLDTVVINNIIEEDKPTLSVNIEKLEDNNTQDEQLSQILPSKALSNRRKPINTMSIELKNDKENENCTPVEEDSQILNLCQEIEANDNIDTPLSPILPNNNTKTRSETTSPLVFNLDKFEHFESIAISLLETNDFDTAKHVINSQILDKELFINMDENVELNERHVSSPVLPINRILERNTESPIIKQDKVIEIDKATSDEILNQLTNQKAESNANIKTDTSVDVFKDEILFSSDEEESYVHKEYQDLPFTCALETSFYDQSDVLDKTMYVGFQTASNRSIQICAESFAKAKSLLYDVTDEEITVTDLVKNCDSLKDTSVEHEKFEPNMKEAEVKFTSKINAKRTGPIEDISTKYQLKTNKEILTTHNITPKNDKFMGFTTANNKKIHLSEKALARCKKVFQDIDLSQNFDEVGNMPENDAACEHTAQETKPYCDNNKEENSKDNVNPIDDVLQGIDDVIIQEFENIEMSLEDNKPPDKEAHFVGFKTASKQDIKISDTALEKMKDIFKDIDFDEDMDVNKNTEVTLPSQILNSLKSKDETNASIDFKTASQTNIKISTKAWDKSKKVFEDIDNTKAHNKLEMNVDEAPVKELDFNQPSTSNTGFIGFKTANNKNINISANALAKTKNIFKDIDKGINTIDEKQTKDATHLYINESSTSKTFLGFKTANNKNIEISEKALLKSKNVFKDIDSIDLPKKTNKDYPKEDNIEEGFKTSNNRIIAISKEALSKTKNILNDIDSPEFQNNKQEIVNKGHQNSIGAENKIERQSSTEFVGFKSASNKEIKVSAKALPQTRNIFKDIDSIEAKFNEKDSNIRGTETAKSPKFIGFKTANNKNIKISSVALENTKNVFKDIDTKDFKLPNKKQKDYPDIEADDNTTNINKPLYNKLMSDKEELTENILDNLPFQEFKTANNKPVKISKEALIESRNIFRDIDSTDFKIANENQDVYPDFENDKDIENEQTYSKQILRHTNDQDGVDITARVDNLPQCQGFKTASNKTVPISKEALIKSKDIFKDIDNSKDTVTKDKITEAKELYPKEFDNGDDKHSRPVSPLFRGFKTANKKLVTVDEKAFKASQKLFGDLRNSDNVAFSGFQTASNKTVKISEKALAKSRSLFKDIDTNSIGNAENNIKTKNLYHEEIYQHEPRFDDVDDRTSFSTRKMVDISEKALTGTTKLVDINRHSFKGFETASNKKVTISKAALERSKKLFQDIDANDRTHENKVIKSNMAAITGNSRPIAISHEVIARSKRPFADLDDNTNNPVSKREKEDLSPKIQENEDISAIMDTQVINNFEESLYTEDFRETPMKSKRSGSPILSCPRAKRRKKFETPYNVKITPKLISEPAKMIVKDKFSFKENYKKDKRYTLKDILHMRKDVSYTIDPYLFNFNYESLLQFEFKHDRNELSYDNMTIETLKELFLNSVNEKLVPNGWLDNHIRLILWKLICYEVKFRCLVCTVENVMNQLKYRYDRELYNAERPALRKIYEKDDVPSKTMVLCVVAVYVDGVRVISVPDCPTSMELLLTDGWYCIRCVIDKMLTQLVCTKKITVGSKIVTSGAELSGCEQGMSPWEDTSGVRLKIFGNSTRRARWDARLGYHGKGAILSQLSSVSVLGGKVSKLRVFVARVYPALYVEKFEDGSTVTRSERLENLHQMKTEVERQALMEKIYEEVEMEFYNQASQDSEVVMDSSRKTAMDSGSQIVRMMKRSKDPVEFREQLTESQMRLLESHTSKDRERLLQDIQTRVRDRLEKAGVGVNRNVVGLLKIKVAGLAEKEDRVEVSKGMMSIWKPNDGILDIVTEGAWIDVLNVLPTAVRYSEIQISAGRQSVFSTSKFKPPEKFQPYIKLLQRQCYSIKELTQNPSMTTDYNEIDTAGLIFLIDPSMELFDSTKQSFQNIYLTDAEKNIICVNFWGGLKKIGFQNVLDTGQVIACVNLQKRAGNTRKTIPQYRVTELSYFTQTPKSDSSRKMLQELNKKLAGLDRRKFCNECVVLKNNFAVIKHNTENISPYRFMNNSEINISKNKVFIDSPLAKCSYKDDNFNLTGLDFETTFKQDSELSEEALKRKRKVNEKIAKLKMYGEPPPLSPIHIINRSKQAASSYKSPLLPKNSNSNLTYRNNNQKGLNETPNLKINDSDSCINVASVRNTPQKCGEYFEASSPILLNRTYVKSVNPVKINFDVKDNNESNVDHFAEEFDGSPPLSLD